MLFATIWNKSIPIDATRLTRSGTLSLECDLRDFSAGDQCTTCTHQRCKRVAVMHMPLYICRLGQSIGMSGQAAWAPFQTLPITAASVIDSRRRTSMACENGISGPSANR